MGLLKTAIGCSLCGIFMMMMLGCASPKPPPVVQGDPELERTNAAARSAFDHGTMLEAATLYEQSLTRARAMDDPREIGDAAYNLAACLSAMDKLDRAHTLLQEALWDLNRAHVNGDDVMLLKARVVRKQGDTQQATSITGQLVSPDVVKRSPAIATEAHFLRVEMACDQHDLPGAQAEFVAAQAVAGPKPDPALEAGLADAAGRIADEQHHPAEAAAHFDHAVDLLQHLGAFAEMSRALDRSGEAYRAAGDPASAADRLYRAARSAFARGNRATARQWLPRALEAAQAAHLSQLSQQIRALAAEMEPDTQPV
jgi:tetratricopeptide (TPR) repeat protein